MFTMDDVGNRSSVKVKDESDVNYVVDNLTNRYESVGGASLRYMERIKTDMSQTEVFGSMLKSIMVPWYWRGVIFALIVLVLVGCVSRDRGSGVEDMGPEQLHNGGRICYPYVANAERLGQIEEGYKYVKRGMDVDEVLGVMGKPDEIRPLYEPVMKNAMQIGVTYWYILRRLERRGSTYEGEALVRICFSNKGEVMRIDRWDKK